MSSTTTGARSATPAARLLVAVVLVTAIATVPVSTPSLALCALVAATTVAVFKPAPRRFASRAAVGGLAILGVLLPLVVMGDAARAALLGARAALSVTIALSIAGTMRGEELVDALFALRVPTPLASVLGTALRQVRVLGDEARRLTLARRLRRARGLDVGGRALARLLTRAAERAQRAEVARALRGYRIEVARRRAALAWRDAPWLLGAVILAVLLHVAPSPLGPRLLAASTVATSPP